jgi:hypothetical protein
LSAVEMDLVNLNKKEIKTLSGNESAQRET